MTRTGASLGNFDVTEHIEPVPRERHTYCVTDHVGNPSLRAAMSIFDDSFEDFGAGPRMVAITNPLLSAQMAKVAKVAFFAGSLHAACNVSLTAPGLILGSTSTLARQVLESVRSPETVSETSAHKFDDVVEVVRDLQHRLGIDLKDVLAAANIKPRTYHSWARPSAPRPRLASQGRLWALAQLVDDLPEILDVPIRQWLLADPERLMILRAGCFDELLEQASQEHMQHDPTGTVAGPFHGVGEDGVGEDSPPSLRTTRRELVIDERAITEPALPPPGSPEPPRR